MAEAIAGTSSDPGSKIHRCKIEVRGYELDSFGHVNHAIYVSYLEHARWKALEADGITLARFNEWKCWPVIAEIQLQYIKPSYIGESLEISTQVVEHARTSFFVEQKITRDGKPVLKGKVRVVLVNENGRPTEMPSEVGRLWEPA